MCMHARYCHTSQGNGRSSTKDAHGGWRGGHECVHTLPRKSPRQGGRAVKDLWRSCVLECQQLGYLQLLLRCCCCSRLISTVRPHVTRHDLRTIPPPSILAHNIHRQPTSAWATRSSNWSISSSDTSSSSTSPLPPPPPPLASAAISAALVAAAQLGSVSRRSSKILPWGGGNV